MLRLILAGTHLLALGIGLGAVWARARLLGASLDSVTLKRALVADSWWGVAAVLWLATGLWRLFAATEKSTLYYMNNHVFFAKMGLFVLVFLLELWPMITLIRWRSRALRPDGATAKRIATISYIECVLVIAIVFAAVAMARGYGSAILKTD
jgi:putative membrane protein